MTARNVATGSRPKTSAPSRSAACGALPYQGPLLSTVEEVVETVDRAAASAAVVRRVRRSA